ncbi:MAG TPA: hypothetical protein VFA56_04230 [Gaiellaceae bacterium]|nr:hypothetical protein [Gaiellaceae bacterium]
MVRQRIVVALDGGSLGDVAAVASSLAPAAGEFELVLTYGHRPGADALAGEHRLDIVSAASQGTNDYMLVQALQSLLPRREVVAVLTRVVVDRDDPAFEHPTVRVGRRYSVREGRRAAAVHGWSMVRDGPGLRRVVPAPEPRSVVEIGAIEELVGDGAVVVCGGGVPVVRDRGLRGVEAVVDGDLTAVLLAEQLDADRLVLASGVTDAKSAPRAAKGEAAYRFVNRTGGTAALGHVRQVVALARGDAGTQIRHPDAVAAAATTLHGEFARRLGKE